MNLLIKKLTNTLLSISLLTISSAAFADLVVISHPSNSSSFTQKDVARIFLGKSKSFPNGELAVAINLQEGSDTTKTFNSKVLKKSDSQLKAYWSKLIFTGKGNPPKIVANDAEVISLISSNPNMIGYINSASVTNAVKVAFKP